MLLVCLETIATTYHSMIFNSCIQFAFSSIYQYSYSSIHHMSGLAAGAAGAESEECLDMMME
jgi:hypothetical protein